MSLMFDANPKVQALIQEGLLERQLLDSLFPELRYRTAFEQASWGESADSVYKTRRATTKPDLRPRATRTDPTPTTPDDEQFLATIALHTPFARDISENESGMSIADQLVQAFKDAGKTSGLFMDLLSRNALFSAGLEGQTIVDGAVTSATAVPVLDISGFGVKWNGITKFGAATVAAPQKVYFRISSAWTMRYLTAVTPATPGATTGPGTLTLSAAISCDDRTPLFAEQSPYIIRAGGGYSIDDVGTTDTLTLSDIRKAVTTLRNRNVPTHDDGMYHCYLGENGLNQLFDDSDVKLIDRGTGLQNSVYKEFMIDKIANCLFFDSSNAPNPDTVAAAGEVDRGIWSAPLTNATSVPIERTIITGKEVGYEYSKAKSRRNDGKGGSMSNVEILNNGIRIALDNMTVIIRDPVDRLLDVSSVAVEFQGTHCIGTDYKSQGAAASGLNSDASSRYKRQVVIEHSAV